MPPPSEPEVTYFTGKEMAERLRIAQVLLRWIVKTQKVECRFIGRRTFYTQKSYEQVDAHLRRHDPRGEFRVIGGGPLRPRRKHAPVSAGE